MGLKGLGLGSLESQGLREGVSIGGVRMGISK